MAQLWLHLPDTGWSPRLLGTSVVGLAPGGGRPAIVSGDRHAAANLHRVRTSAGSDAWLLIAAGALDVRVNGDPVVAGLRALADRDHISLGATTIYFSTESLAVVEPFVETETAVYCPRCKQAIAADTQVVRCPRCAVVHHASDDLPCWTYAERCALCDQITDPDAGYRWTPEEL